MKKVVIAILFFSGFLLAEFDLPFYVDQRKTADSVAEARQVFEKAKANKPFIDGTAVPTIAGAQLTPPGTMPQEVRINQQIFNDIGRLREKMLEFMIDVTSMGIRYDLVPEFELIKKRLEETMTQIENDLRLKLIY